MYVINVYSGTDTNLHEDSVDAQDRNTLVDTIQTMLSWCHLTPVE